MSALDVVLVLLFFQDRFGVSMFRLMWLFIFIVVGIDVLFTYTYHPWMNEWEANPIQLFIYNNYGYEYCIVLRLISMIFGFTVICSLEKFSYIRWYGTVFTYCVHLILYFQLLFSILEFTNG